MAYQLKLDEMLDVALELKLPLAEAAKLQIESIGRALSQQIATALDKIAEVEAEYANFEDNNPGGSCGWTTDSRARMYGVAVDWVDRHW